MAGSHLHTSDRLAAARRRLDACLWSSVCASLTLRVDSPTPWETPMLLVASLLYLVPAAADTPDIPRLIQQLGSPEYSEREAASNRLETIGAPALEALRKAARDSDDPEIR